MKKLIFLLVVLINSTLLSQVNKADLIWEKGGIIPSEIISHFSIDDIYLDSLIVFSKQDYFFIYNIKSGYIIYEIENNNDFKLSNYIFSLNNNLIALIDSMKVVSIINYQTGEKITEFDYKYNIHSFNEDGSIFIQMNNDVIELYSTSTGKMLKRDSIQIKNNIKLSQNGKIFSSIHKDSVEFWSIDSLKLFKKYQLEGNNFDNFILSTNGDLFSYTDTSDKIHLLEVKSGNYLNWFSQIDIEEQKYCLSKNLAYLATLEMFVGGYYVNVYSDSNTQKYKCDIDYDNISFLPQPSIFYLSNDGSIAVFDRCFLYGCSSKIEMPTFAGEILVFNIQKNSTLFSFPDLTAGISLEVLFSVDGKKIMVHGASGINYFFDSFTGKLTNTMTNITNSKRIKSMLFTPDNNLLINNIDVLYFYNIERRFVEDSIITNSNFIRNISFSPSGDKIAFKDTISVYIYDLSNKKLINIFTPDSTNISFRYSSIFRFSNDGDFLTIFNQNKKYFKYNISTGQEILNQSLNYQGSYIEDVSKYGDYILLYNNDTVSLFDVNKEEIVYQKELVHIYEYRSARFLNSNSHKLILINETNNPLDYDESNYVINLETGERCDLPSSEGDYIYPSPDGEHFAYYSCPGRYGYGRLCEGFITNNEENKHAAINFNLILIPNPVYDITKINFYNEYGREIQIQIFNTLGVGQLNLAVNEFFDSGQHNIQLSTKGLPSGMYFCVLRAGANVQTSKFVVMK
ncbi:MAG: T9SS type A sorting domain-containing protein [bacterium]